MNPPSSPIYSASRTDAVQYLEDRPAQTAGVVGCDHPAGVRRTASGASCYLGRGAAHEYGDPSRGARYITFRVVTEAEHPFAFLLYLLVPPGPGPFPVVLNGDACWRYVTDEIAAEVLRRGNILAQFNRVEIAADVPSSERNSGIYPLHPGGTTARWPLGHGAIIAAWMCWRRWNSWISAAIAVVGHSRGGKATCWREPPTSGSR